MNLKNLSKNKISILRFLCQITYLLLFVYSIFSKNTILMIALVSAVLIGPIFCGWFCFFGLYQDALRYIGKLIKKQPLEIDEKLHRYLKFSRFFVFFAAMYIGGIFLFPDEMKHSMGAFLHGHIIINIAFWAFVVLGILSLFTKRFYCRYCCTFGAKLGLISLFRLITIKRNKENCINCKTCSNECTMHIDVHKCDNLVSANCINCFKCIEKCPKNCLNLGFRNYLKV